MKLKFVIDFRTQWGQHIYVSGSAKELGAGDYDQAVKMFPKSGEQWEVEVETEDTEFKYHYFLRDESGATFHEFGVDRTFSVPKSFDSVHIRDYWRPHGAHQNSLYTAPFAKAFFSRENTEAYKPKFEAKQRYVRLHIRAPRIGKDYQMAIVGSIKALGGWDEKKAVMMSDEDFPVWKADIPVSEDDVPFEYKYVIYSHKEKKVVTWESSDNRYFPLYNLKSPQKLFIHTDEFFGYPVGEWKTAGVAIPVFSLRTKESAGVGEFEDIKKLVDWTVLTGMKVVQVLPVNDTVANHTWQDSYPYAAISVQALHPIYANMKSIGLLKSKKAQKEINEEADRLNALPQVDYEAVMKLKSKFFKLSYDENKESFLKSKAFKDFLKSNESWLIEYAAFSYLRDLFGTPDFTQWGEYQSLNDKELAALVSPRKKHYDDVAVHYYIQYHLDKQLKSASEYAREKGVVLKGDIPIGIYRNSVDAWRKPHLFNMDTQAGAPPDDFSISGQNWGFPTYNWEEMEKDGFQWWKDRMVKMSEYFDVFRIDHILGFFRIWEIPWEHVEGLMGRFNPALPVNVDEMHQWGIPFDYERFCAPYIRQHMIYDIFGNHADAVFDQYLEEYKHGHYRLKLAFDTQRKIKLHFDKENKANPEGADFNNWIRNNLNRLLGEVLFLESPLSDGQAFNPRVGMHSTYSFGELDDYTKQKLDDLYIHFFYRRHNDFWRDSAMKKLPMLKDATDMLICGEDLGMVPASVPGVMNELQILSLAIQRMPNDDREFWHPADTPYMSVTSTGSHDMSTLREWWQEDHDQTNRFYHQILNRDGEAPYFCEPWIARDIINQHLHSPSMLAIFPIQDLIAMDGALRYHEPEAERINVPANPTHYWRWRFHMNMEDLMEEEGFNSFLRQLIDQGGRSADY
jgi:4-alpha-glucanotransferase